MTGKTLDEHAETVRETLMRSDGHIVAVYAAAYEAERAARVALEARVRELEAALEETRELAEEGRLSAADRGVAMVAAEAWHAETIARFSEVFGEPVVVPPVGSEFGPKNEYEVRVFEREAIVARVLSIVARAEKAEAELARGRSDTSALSDEHERAGLLDQTRPGTIEGMTELLTSTRARVRELEAERDETRAQLARLREAVAEPERRHFGDGKWHHTCRVCGAQWMGGPVGGIHPPSNTCALSTPSPTLAEIRRAASDFREIRPSVDGDLDAAVDRAQAEGCVLDFPALVRLCMDPQVDTLIYAITEAGAVFLFSETCVRKEVAEIRRDAQAEVLREMAKEIAPPASPTMGSAAWDAWQERIARQFGTFDAVAIHDWLRRRADILGIIPPK